MGEWDQEQFLIVDVATGSGGQAPLTRHRAHVYDDWRSFGESEWTPPALILQGTDNFLAFFQKEASKFEINRVIITPLHRGALAQLVEQRTLKNIFLKDKKSSAFCLPVPRKKAHRYHKILPH